jgi:hypothetical protein
METISTILLLGFAAAPIALVGGWLAGRGHGRLGALVTGPASDGWWRTAMPLPRGVQEDDDFKWNFGDRDQATSGSEPLGPSAAKPADDVEPATTRVRPRVRIR